LLGANAALLRAANHHDLAADADAHVARLDAGQLDQDADRLAVVDDVDVRVPGRGRGGATVVRLDERGEQTVQLALEPRELDDRTVVPGRGALHHGSPVEDGIPRFARDDAVRLRFTASPFPRARSGSSARAGTRRRPRTFGRPTRSG